MNNVLFLRHDKAGDALKTLPVIRALVKQKLPNQYYILTSTHNYSIFEFESDLKAICLPPNWESLSKIDFLKHLNNNGLPTNLTSVINLLCDASVESDKFLLRFTDYPLWSVHPYQLKDKSIHLLSLNAATSAKKNETENIAELIQQTFNISLCDLLKNECREPQLTETDQEEALNSMGEKKGLWIGICPFAGNHNRTHPFKHWLSFFKKASNHSSVQRFFLFGTINDQINLNALKNSSIHSDKIQICKPSSFRTLGAFLKRLDGVVAVDSGPLHLAQALKIKSLGFLSGGDHKRWFPDTSAESRIIKKGLFTRYPTSIEMQYHFSRWLNKKPS